MKINRGVIAGATVAAALALTGSAFTATSTLDDQAINVGSVSQSVSGATFTNVAHAYTAATDTTTAISARAAELLSTEAGVVAIFLNGSSTADAAGCTVTHVDTDADTVDDASDVACNITDTVNLTALRFVVNG